jgi:RNA polymerase sigma factor (sigma-70 family)
MKALTQEQSAKVARWKLKFHQELLRRGRVYSRWSAHYIEEAVQHTWLKAVLYIDTLEQLGEDKVLPYLTRVMVNYIRGIATASRREAAMDGSVFERAVTPPDPDELPTVSDEQWARAICKLPPRTRETFLLRRQGYKYREIAERMGITSGAVGALLADAYECLRKELRRSGV